MFISTPLRTEVRYTVSTTSEFLPVPSADDFYGADFDHLTDLIFGENDLDSDDYGLYITNVESDFFRGGLVFVVDVLHKDEMTEADMEGVMTDVDQRVRGFFVSEAHDIRVD